LCTGEFGVGAVTRKVLSYKGCRFHRVVKDLLCATGDFEASASLTLAGLRHRRCRSLCIYVTVYAYDCCTVVGVGRGGLSVILCVGFWVSVCCARHLNATER
jgi:hypothetical protein